MPFARWLRILLTAACLGSFSYSSPSVLSLLFARCSAASLARRSQRPGLFPFKVNAVTLCDQAGFIVSQIGRQVCLPRSQHRTLRRKQGCALDIVEVVPAEVDDVDCVPFILLDFFVCVPNLCFGSFVLFSFVFYFFIFFIFIRSHSYPGKFG